METYNVYVKNGNQLILEFPNGYQRSFITQPGLKPRTELGEVVREMMRYHLNLPGTFSLAVTSNPPKLFEIKQSGTVKYHPLEKKDEDLLCDLVVKDFARIKVNKVK